MSARAQSQKDRPSSIRVLKEKERKFNNVEQIFRTKGLTSVDRSNKATLPLTVPRSHSSRLQRIHPRACNNYDSRPNRQGLSAQPAEAAQCGTRAKLYLNTSLMCGTYVVASGTDSGLEAFSHNPADDSFAPLPDRTGANTKYLNELFLSY